MLVLFVGVTVLSHVLLPEGLLRGRNPLQGWEESGSTATLAAQIFVYNLVSVAMIALASLFASRKDDRSAYLSAGYLAFFVLVTANAVTLGTWSFSLGGEPAALLTRVAGMFQVWRRSGLWEMSGQLLVTCALARAAVVRTTGRTTETRSLREARPSRPELVTVAVGLALMLAGAIIESLAIHT